MRERLGHHGPEVGTGLRDLTPLPPLELAVRIERAAHALEAHHLGDHEVFEMVRLGGGRRVVQRDAELDHRADQRVMAGDVLGAAGHSRQTPTGRVATYPASLLPATTASCWAAWSSANTPSVASESWPRLPALSG